MRFDMMRSEESVDGKLVGVKNVSVDGRLVAQFVTPQAFSLFVGGVSAAKFSLYDNDRKVYIVGTVAELLGEA